MAETAYTDDFSPLFRSTRDAMDGARWDQTLAVGRRPTQVQTRQDVSTLVREIAPKYGVDPRLVEAVIGLESGGQADVISRKGAQGVMQLMPGTAKRFGVTDPLDPAQNIEGGVRYLAWLRDQFPGRTDLQLAGYHAGEGAVRNAGYTIPQTHDGNMSTGQYVATVLRRYTPTLPGEEGRPVLDVRDALARQSVREGTPGPTLHVTTDPSQLSMQARGGKPAQGLPGEGGIPPLDLSRETQQHVMDLPGTRLTVETDMGNLMARTAGQPTALQPGQRPFDAAHPALEPGLVEDRAGRIVGGIATGAVGMVENLLQSVVAGENLVGLTRPAVPGMTDPMGVELLLPPIKGLEKSIAPRLGGEAPDLVDKLANGLGTSLASLLPGAAAQRFLRGVSTVAPRLARLGGAVTSGLIEAAGEAGGVYEQMAPIVGEGEASKRALTSFAANAVLVTATDKLGIFGEEGRLLRRALAGAISNGAQEAMQYDIERRQLWVPANHQAADGLKAAGWIQEGARLVKPFAAKDMGEAALIGMLIGGPAAAAVGAVAERELPQIRQVVEQEQRAVATQIPDTLVKDPEGQPLRVYHGTPAPFDQFRIDTAVENSLYGPGIYFTDNPQVAEGYSKGQARGPTAPDLLVSPEAAREAIANVPDLLNSERRAMAELGDNELAETIANMAERGYAIDAPNLISTFAGQPNIRPAYLNITNPFDINADLSAAQVRALLGQMPETTRPVLEGLTQEWEARGWQGVNADDVYDLLTRAFGGDKAAANRFLQQQGYDGIAHTGGQVSGGESHQVYIAFSPEQVIPAFSIDAALQAVQQPDTPPPGVEPSTWQRWGAYLTNLLPDIQPGPGGRGGFLGGERGSLGTGAPTLRMGAEGLTPERYRTPSGGWRIPLRDMPSQELDLKDFIVQQGGIKLAGEELRGELEAVISRKETGLVGLQNNASGMSLQAMAETAAEQGFIPSADKEALLQALDRNIVQGHPVPSVYATGRIALLDDPYVSAGYQAVLDAVEAVRGRTEEQVAGVRHRRAVHAEAAALIEEGAFSHDDIREIFPNTTLNDTMASALVQSLNTIGEEMADAAQRYLDAGARVGSHEEASLQELMALLAELDPIRLGVSAAQSRGLGILNDPLSGYTQFLNNLHRALETAPDKTMAQIAKNILAAKPQQALTKEELAKNPERLAEIFAAQREMIERFQASPLPFQLEQQEPGNLALFEQRTPEQQALVEAAYTPEGDARTPQEWDQVFRAQAQARLLEAWQAGEFERQRARDAIYEDMVNLNQQREAARQRAMEDWSAEDRARDEAYQQAREVWARQAVERADARWREGMRDYRQFQEDLRQGYQGRQLDLPPREGEPRREPTQLLLLDEYREVQQALTDYREGRATEAQQDLLDAVLRPWTATQEQLKLPRMKNLIASMWPGLRPWDVTEERLQAQLQELARAQAQAPAQLPVMKALMESTRPGFEAYFRELMYNAWLSNPSTHITNFVSNLGVTAWALPERYLAQWYQDDASGVPRGEASAMLYGLVHGIQDAWTLAYRSFKAGQPLSGLGREYTREPVATAQNMGLNPESAFGKFVNFFFEYIGLGSGGRLPSRALMASDEFFKMLNYRAELNALAYRDAVRHGYEGTAFAEHVTKVISSPQLSQIQEASKTFSIIQTFQNALTPGGVGEFMQGISNYSPRMFGTEQRFPVGTTILPFVQTPSNIARYAFERTPLGVFLGTYHDDLRAGGERADLAQAKIDLGTFAMVGLAGLALSGRLTGRGPEDRDLREIWLQTYRPYSVKLPTGQWVSLDRFEPAGTLVKMIGDLVQVAGEANVETWTKATLAPIVIFLKGVTNATYFQSLSEFFDIMAPDFASKDQEWGAKLQRFGRQKGAGMLIPSSLMAATARFLDPVERDAQSLVDALYTRIPGWKDDIPARRTLGGEKVLFGSGIQPDIFANFVGAYSPVKLGSGKMLLADQEMLKNKMSIDKPSRSLAHKAVPLGKLAENVPTDPGQLEPLRLTPEQYERRIVLSAGNEVQAQKLGLELPAHLIDKLVSDLSREYNAVPPKEVRSLTNFLNWAAEQDHYKAQTSGPGEGKEQLFQRAIFFYRQLGEQLLLQQDKSLLTQAGESQIMATIRQLPLAQRPGTAQSMRTGLSEAATRTQKQLGLHVGAPK
jgi:hypothetical protein